MPNETMTDGPRDGRVEHLFRRVEELEARIAALEASNGDRRMAAAGGMRDGLDGEKDPNDGTVRLPETEGATS